MCAHKYLLSVSVCVCVCVCVCDHGGVCVCVCVHGGVCGCASRGGGGGGGCGGGGWGGWGCVWDVRVCVCVSTQAALPAAKKQDVDGEACGAPESCLLGEKLPSLVSREVLTHKQKTDLSLQPFPQNVKVVKP